MTVSPELPEEQDNGGDRVENVSFSSGLPDADEGHPLSVYQTKHLIVSLWGCHPGTGNSNQFLESLQAAYSNFCLIRNSLPEDQRITQEPSLSPKSDIYSDFNLHFR